MLHVVDFCSEDSWFESQQGSLIFSCVPGTFIFFIIFIYLFIQTYFHTSHSGTYHGNGKSHIHYTSSGIYNLIQLTAGWKEYIKPQLQLA